MVFGLVKTRLPFVIRILGRYRVKSKNFPGFANRPSSLAPRYCSNFLNDKVPTLPTSTQGRNIPMATVLFISGTGSTSSNSPTLINLFNHQNEKFT